jgi:transcriptional regulator with XRE-family HTH domain
MYFDPTPRVLLLFRRSRGLTQEEAAARTGTDQGTVSSWELGKRRPRRDHMWAYLQKLGCMPEEFASFQARVLFDEFGKLDVDPQALWESLGFYRDLGKLEYVLKDRIKETRKLLEQVSSADADLRDLKNRLIKCEFLWSSSIAEYEDIDRIVKDKWDEESE